ncbi:CYTH domain-containing protein [Streptococcus chenjunshii]|uniref:CYTH domain-containing protein n=1 Tax=Streptococcus chenjunshii TaxID=2173853 RepID=A0A372KP75_9STRE|nr:CYTH domain-containing protein [Streptococcus chenjunshii]AXQ78647.1 CYTH domain-containing protein [Streptococcus chenjunshii]RFU51889.1 CYTH domain-containing protein [Streptococcus chenjunshii]RFU54081.1 CYTH domain-containing protein [Streptococcus chenjunshii]
MTHLEIEYKTLLNKDEFKRLTAHFSHIPQITQTNYYFDSHDFSLKAHRMLLRIRTFSDRAELTLKLPKTVGNLEYNHHLTLPQAKEIIKSGHLPPCSIRELIGEQGVNPDDLAVFGHLTTDRRESQTAIGLLALDCNHYTNIKDYELELEVKDADSGKKDFAEFLVQHDIAFKYAKSKIARLTNSLKAVKKLK